MAKCNCLSVQNELINNNKRMDQKVNIGLYVLTCFCLAILAASKFLAVDTALIVPITWALLGAILGRNTEGLVSFGKAAASKFKK